MRRLLPHSAKIGGGLGVVALFFFIVWFRNTKLLTGHYETHWGPGWQIGIAALACVVGVGLAVTAIVQRMTGKRLLLLIMLVLLSLPILFLALAQVTDPNSPVSEFYNLLKDSRS